MDFSQIAIALIAALLGGGAYVIAARLGAGAWLSFTSGLLTYSIMMVLAPHLHING